MKYNTKNHGDPDIVYTSPLIGGNTFTKRSRNNHNQMGYHPAGLTAGPRNETVRQTDLAAQRISTLSLKILVLKHRPGRLQIRTK